MNNIRIGIVGAGQGGSSLLKILQGINLVKITCICEINKDAIGLIEAEKQSIPVYENLPEMIDNEEIDLLINVADTSITRRFLLTRELKDINIIDGQLAELGWNILLDLHGSIYSNEVLKSDEEKENVFTRAAWEVIRNIAYSSYNIQKEINDMSFFDPLTGLFARRMLNEFLNYQVIVSLRNQSDLSLIIMDIDNFKVINDKWGHAEGDTILKNLAFNLKDYFRKSDLIARYGGEEFIIVLPEVKKVTAADKAEGFRKYLKDNLVNPDDTSVTLSFGIADMKSIPFKESYNISYIIEKLLFTADKALYKSKEDGKDRITVF